MMLFDVKSMDVFHRFVRPRKMSEQRINQCIEGKYGHFVVDRYGLRVWHDTAITFVEVIEQFEAWLDKHKLRGNRKGGCLKKGAFVICGNWDSKTSIPRQCAVSSMKLLPYFMEWIKLKDVYLNFNNKAPGMVSMMWGLWIPEFGNHQLGIDDARNIARVLQHMLTDGALLEITARKSPDAPDNVKFLFQNRIRYRSAARILSMHEHQANTLKMVTQDSAESCNVFRFSFSFTFSLFWLLEYCIFQ